MTVTIDRGEPVPLGATEVCDGFNVAVFSRHATRMGLLLVDPGGATSQTIGLDPDRHRTPDIEVVRGRQIKILLATLLLSRGVPMLLGGDEFRRTQRGNSNAYCQDNEISWYDWSLARRNAGLVRFVRRLAGLRKAHPVLRADTFYTNADIAWFGAEGGPPDWNAPDNQLGCLVRERPAHAPAAGLCLLFNASRRPCRFVLPPAAVGPWRVAIDTGQPPPADIADAGAEPSLANQETLTLEGRSTTVLLSR